MKYIELFMRRDDLKDIPKYDLPLGYSFHLYQAGDEVSWAEIESSVGEFESVEKALDHFNQEFGDNLDKMAQRCVFIKNECGELIGTTTAWYGSLDKKVEGRIHWVAIKSAYQGKGLAKPLLSYALNIMSKFHESTYLSSQTTSYRAINLYLLFGFKPVYKEVACREGWEMMEEVLGKNIIE